MMWITEEETVADLTFALKQETLDGLTFFNVEFSERILTHLQQLKGRTIKKLRLLSCRGILDSVISFILQEIQLEELRLDRVHLDETIARIFAQGLVYTKTLKCLHFNDIFISRPLVEALKQGLLYCQSLQHLVWNNDGLSSTAEAHELKLMILNARKLKTLELWKHSFQDAHIAELLQSIHDHPSLLHLRISIKNLSNVTKAIDDINKSPKSKLCTIQLAIDGPLHDIHRLPSNGRIMYSIEPVTTKDEDMDNLGQTLIKNPNIFSLDLSHNGLTDKGIVALASKLGKVKGLKQLCINGNTITKTSAQALLLALKANVYIEKLDLPFRCEYTREIQHCVDLNKGGRKLLLHEMAPLSLWPLLLERANASFSKKSDQSNHHFGNFEGRRASVVYKLLQELVGLLNKDYY